MGKDQSKPRASNEADHKKYKKQQVAQLKAKKNGFIKSL